MPMTEVPPVTEMIPNELNYATDARRWPMTCFGVPFGAQIALQTEV
jgi:hypothetical protein